MKHLFSIRHGQYNNAGMTPKEKSQFEENYKIIKEIMGNKSVIIISAPLPRALEGAGIIANKFNVDEVISDHYLWSAKDASSNRLNFSRDHDKHKLVSVVESYENKADGIIVISHLGAAGALARFYGRESDMDIPHFYELRHGQMAHLDFSNNTFKIFR